MATLDNTTDDFTIAASGATTQPLPPDMDMDGIVLIYTEPRKGNGVAPLAGR